MSQHLISDDAGELIIAQEVSSEAIYAKRYQHPERPGGESGITIGIGYDCGYSSAAQIRTDWGGRISDAMVEVLATRCARLTGSAAQERLAEVRPQVLVPWDAAIAEFYAVEVPRWLAKCRSVLPNLDTLPPDCIGALVSLAYNRGPSFTVPVSKDPTGRYAEMRAIRAHMVAKEFAKIPGEFRKMKRLWPQPSMRGLIGRREEEAKLFERGLAAMPQHVADVAQDAEDDALDQTAARAPVTGDDRNIVPAPAADPVPENAYPTAPIGGVDTDLIIETKKKLDTLGYHEFGVLNAEWGGRTVAAIAAYKLDRGMTGPATIDAALTAQLDNDIAAGWRRPMREERVKATVQDLAPTNATIKQNWWTRLWAKIVAIPAGAAALINGVMEKFPDAKANYIDPVSAFFSDVPGWLWFAGAGGIALAIWIGTRKSDTSVVQSFQDGRLLR